LFTLKSIFFWDMTPCSALSGTRRFGGMYSLHLQGRRIVQQSSEQASGKRSLPAEDRYIYGTEGRTQFLLVSPGQGETGGLNHRTNKKIGLKCVVLKNTAKKHCGGWRRYVPPKRRVPLNALHGVISQKKILFKTTAVKTSNPTFVHTV
jgi:hypothetical protein